MLPLWFKRKGYDSNHFGDTRYEIYLNVCLFFTNAVWIAKSCVFQWEYFYPVGMNGICMENMFYLIKV